MHVQCVHFLHASSIVVMFSTSNINTLTHLCTCSRPFYVCVLLCPAGMVAGEWVCVCVCICACWHVFCLYVDGVAVEGVGVLGTGEINQCLAGKRPSFCPLCFPSSPPPPPTATLSLHVFDPSIVRRCTSSCGRLHPNKMQGRHLFIEKKLKYTRLNERSFITD